MIIKLVNFKGIADGTYVFPNQGTIRLEGPNGSGKTCVLMAMVWGLCGKVPRARSFAKRGTKVFSVAIEDFQGLSIKRVNSPNKLTVTDTKGVVTEDREAEEVLSGALGTDVQRAAWGMLQTSTSSLIGLSPADQYQVLSEISGVDLEDVKARVAATQQSLSTYAATISAYEISLAKYETTEKRIASELPDLPIGRSAPKKAKAVEAEIAAKSVTVDELSLSLEGVSEDPLAPLQASLDELMKIKAPVAPEADVAALRTTYEGYRLLLAALTSSAEHQEYVKTTTAEKATRIAEIEKKLRLADPDLREKVSQLRDDHREYEKALTRYEATLQTKADAQAMMKKTFTDIKRVWGADHPQIADAKTPKTMLAALTSLRKTYLHVLACPSCGSGLVENQGTLEVADGEESQPDPKAVTRVDDYAAKFHPKLLSDFQMKLIHPGDPPADLAKLEKKLAEYEALRGELRTLNIGADPIAKKLEVKATRDRAAVEALGQDWLDELDAIDAVGCSTYIEDLGVDLEEATKASARYEDRLATYTSAKKRIPALKAKIASLSSVDSPLVISRKITALTNEIAAAKTFLATNEARAKREALEAELEKIKTNSEAINKELEECRNLIKGLTEVRKLIKTAALMTFERTLEAINATAATYLEKFFNESVRVALVIPEGSKGKTVVEVFHKNQESSYEDFSLGETQKVRLAFFLAISKVLGVRVMLIDEALSSIDEASRPTVLDAIVGSEHVDVRVVVTHSEDLAFDEVVSLG